jgi:hypothetical protein
VQSPCAEAFTETLLLGKQLKALLENAHTIISLGEQPAEDAFTNEANPWAWASTSVPALKELRDGSSQSIADFNLKVAYNKVQNLIAVLGEEKTLGTLKDLSSKLKERHEATLFVVGPLMRMQSARVSYEPQKPKEKRKRSEEM